MEGKTIQAWSTCPMAATIKKIIKIKNSAFTRKALLGTTPAKPKRPKTTAINKNKNDQTDIRAPTVYRLNGTFYYCCKECLK